MVYTICIYLYIYVLYSKFVMEIFTWYKKCIHLYIHICIIFENDRIWIKHKKHYTNQTHYTIIRTIAVVLGISVVPEVDVAAAKE